MKKDTGHSVSGFKKGSIVIITQGRLAGKKAMIVKPQLNGTKERRFHHLLVAGLEKTPKLLTKGSTQKEGEKKREMRSFIKQVNARHVMPTRYKVKKEVEIKDLNEEDLQNKEARKKAVEKINDLFSKAYNNANVDRAKIGFLYEKLQF